MIQNGDILENQYKILNEIGSGGTGVVYLAMHLHLRKKVVVKKIKDHFVGQVNARAEVDILKNLHHSNLPQVYDFCTVDSCVYTVMEYIEGMDLKQYLDQGYSFPEELLRGWLRDLCQVLDYLHSQNPPILHSDIKPANLMVDGNLRIYLIDFNISIDGDTTKDVQGISQWYAAPEQYQNAIDVMAGKLPKFSLDGRMDLYSLGATFYHLMTGRMPVIDPNTGEVPDILNFDIPYSNGLKSVISKAMKMDPAKRFPSAKKMLQAVKNTEKMDPVYRRYERLQIGSVFVWVMLLIMGALSIYYGNWQRGVENWQASYQELYISVENEDETQIVSQGTQMLNSFNLRGYFKKNVDKKAEILHIVGDSYFRQEKFDQAEIYYLEAWRNNASSEKYFSDYVITLIRDGDANKAEMLLKEDGESLLSSEENSLIAAETSYAQDKDQEALKSLESIKTLPTTEDNKDVKTKAGELAAEIYESQEDYESAMEALEEVLVYDSSKGVLRKTGQLAVQAATDSDSKADYFLNKALTCYSRLNNLENPSYQDRLNLATVKRGLGDYQGSNDILKALENEYPEEYELPMWQCYNYISIAKENKSYSKIQSDLNFEYKAAKHIYDTFEEKNEDMEKLIAAMKELEK